MALPTGLCDLLWSLSLCSVVVQGSLGTPVSRQVSCMLPTHVSAGVVTSTGHRRPLELEWGCELVVGPHKGVSR